MTFRTRTYAAGGWYGILGARVTLLLPPPERERVPDLWLLTDGGAAFDEVLDALAPGLSRLSECVLVGRDDDGARLLVRGSAAVTAVSGGERTYLAAPPGATWLERRLDATTGLEVLLEASVDAAPELCAANGLVRLARLREHPVPRSVADRLDRAAVARTDRETDHDGSTRSGLPTPAPVPPLPGITGQAPAPGVMARAVARLALSTGEHVDVDRPVLVGRAPHPRHPAVTPPRLVTVSSPRHEISSTHLEVRPGWGADHGSAVVTDVGSTNGTVLLQPGLPPEDLRPGIAVQLLPGAVIDLGDDLTLRVVAP